MCLVHAFPVSSPCRILKVLACVHLHLCGAAEYKWLFSHCKFDAQLLTLQPSTDESANDAQDACKPVFLCTQTGTKSPFPAADDAR
jgi:hypothetical protein